MTDDDFVFSGNGLRHCREDMDLITIGIDIDETARQWDVESILNRHHLIRKNPRKEFWSKLTVVSYFTQLLKFLYRIGCLHGGGGGWSAYCFIWK